MFRHESSDVTEEVTKAEKHLHIKEVNQYR